MKRVLLAVMLGVCMMVSVLAETVLRKSNDSEPSTLDPQLAQGSPEMHILRDMYVGLVDEAADASLIPGVAERWNISEDGKQYIFHLRESKWSDGSPVTAEDFVYAWRRAVDPAIGSKYAFFLYPVVNAKEISEGKLPPDRLAITALDARTLKVELTNPTPYFLGMLVNAITYPVPKAVVEKYGKAWTRAEHVVSNGAYTLKDWLPNVRVTLVKSPTYYDVEAVSVDKVIYYAMPDFSAALRRYRAGELDFTSDVSNDDIAWVLKNMPDDLHIYNRLGTFYFGFNLTKPPFKDNLALREALTLAIDRALIVEHVTASGEKSAYNFVVPETQNAKPYIPDYSQLSRSAQIEKAKKRYAEAGYSKEKPLKVEILYVNNENDKKIAVAIASMWKQGLGVESDLIAKEWKSYLADRREYATQVFRGSWLGDYNDANTFLDLFITGGGSNTVGLADAEYDKLIAEAEVEHDTVQRARILQKAEQRLLDNYSLIPLYFYVSKHMVKPYVQGYKENIMDHWQSKYIRIAPH